MKSSLVLKYFFPALVIAFAAWMAISSTGFLEPDELTHFLKARAFAHGDWKQLLDIWGRPACTGLFGIASLLGGIVAARLLAAAIFALAAIGAVKLWQLTSPPQDSPLKTQTSRGGSAFWIWMLMLAQPLVLLNSFTVMTEMLLACAWVWAAVLLAKNKPNWAGLLIGLGALARPEGVIAIFIFPLALLAMWHSRPRLCIASFAIALIPSIAWWLLGALSYGDPAWPLHHFPWSTQSPYGHTGLVFVQSSLIALAIWMWAPLAIGLWTLRKNPPQLRLLAGPVLGFFALHAILAIGGWLGSMALPRYFICVSPFIAILTLRGITQMEPWIGKDWWGKLLRRAVLFACVLPLIAGVVFEQLPVAKSMNLQKLDFAISAFERRIPPNEREQWLIAEHPYIFYRTGISLDAQPNTRAHSRDSIRTAPVGTVLITDAITWTWENNPTPDELTQWGYVPDFLVASEVSAVPPRWDLSMIASKGGGEVEMWIKTK